MEARRVVIVLTVAEVAVALLLAWLLYRLGFATHASTSMDLGAGEWFVLGAMWACLGMFVFVLAFWQWKLDGRGRFRVLLVLFVSLLWAFCGLCWHDVGVRTAELSGGGSTRAQLAQLREQTAAAMVTMLSVAFGVVGLIVVLWLDRRARARQSQT